MNLEQYKKRRAELVLQEPKYRAICSLCNQPDFGCYCAQVQPFQVPISFVVLIHPLEVKRRIATGRMSHLVLQNSYLIKGDDYTQNSLVNELINDKDHHSMVLYPGPASQNLSLLNPKQRNEFFPKNKKLRVFVIDGTWATARKMMRLSENIKTLPRVCFAPEKPSNFRVRKQPHELCYSTIEAIHHTIELVGDSQGFDVQSRLHDRLLFTFNYMVERQLSFIKASKSTRVDTYRREQLSV